MIDYELDELFGVVKLSIAAAYTVLSPTHEPLACWAGLVLAEEGNGEVRTDGSPRSSFNPPTDLFHFHFIS